MKLQIQYWTFHNNLIKRTLFIELLVLHKIITDPSCQHMLTDRHLVPFLLISLFLLKFYYGANFIHEKSEPLTHSCWVGDDEGILKVCAILLQEKAAINWFHDLLLFEFELQCPQFWPSHQMEYNWKMKKYLSQAADLLQWRKKK